MSKVLLVFQILPEETIFIAIPTSELTEADKETLTYANGKFINSDEDTDYVNLVSDYIAKDASYCESEDNPDNCKWFKYVIDASKPMVGPFETVYQMGFCL